MLSGTISTGLAFIVSAVKYPLYIHFLGYEHYGAWLLLSTVLAFAQMGLLGIGTAIIKLVAEEYGKNDNAIQEYFTTALCMLALMGVLLLTIAILFKWQFVSLMGLKGESIHIVSGLLIYMVVFSIGVMAYQILNAVLSGVGRIDIANYSQTLLQVLPLLLSIPLLMAGKGVVSLLLANVFAYCLVFLFNLIQLNRLVSLRLLNITSFSWRRLQKMIAFGGTVFGGYMLSMLVLPVTKIAITRSIGVEEVPVFELAYRVSMQVRSIFEIAFRALIPEISKYSSEGSPDSRKKMKAIISKAYRVLFLAAIPIYTLAFVFSELIFKIWLGGNYIPSIPATFKVMLIASLISLIGVVQYYTFMGQGLAGKILINHIISACGTLFVMGIVVNFLPIVDVVIFAWCFTVGTFTGTIYLYMAKLDP